MYKNNVSFFNLIYIYNRKCYDVINVSFSFSLLNNIIQHRTSKDFMDKKFENTLSGQFHYNPDALLNSPTTVKENISTIKKSELKDYRPVLLETIQNEPNKPFLVRTILQSAGVKNLNGRMYSKDILEREASKYMAKVNERRALGQLDHPSTGTSSDSLVLLKEASHLIVKMYWQGNDLYGILEILNTPSGQIAKQLIMDRVQLGISSRGLGTVTKTNEGVDKVDDDYDLISFDLVSENSVPNAKLETLQESISPIIVSTPPKLSKEDHFNMVYQFTYDAILKRMSGMNNKELMEQMI